MCAAVVMRVSLSLSPKSSTDENLHAFRSQRKGVVWVCLWSSDKCTVVALTRHGKHRCVDSLAMPQEKKEEKYTYMSPVNEYGCTSGTYKEAKGWFNGSFSG